jgi:hypothetical protein
MYVIKNLSKEPVTLDGVPIEPGEQLSVAVLSQEMIAASNAGTLQVRSGDETLEERKADVAALNSFNPKV